MFCFIQGDQREHDVCEIISKRPVGVREWQAINHFLWNLTPFSYLCSSGWSSIACSRTTHNVFNKGYFTFWGHPRPLRSPELSTELDELKEAIKDKKWLQSMTREICSFMRRLENGLQEERTPFTWCNTLHVVINFDRQVMRSIWMYAYYSKLIFSLKITEYCLF